MLLERRDDEGLERVEETRANTLSIRDEALAVDGTLDGIGMHIERLGDGADLPVLGEEQPTDPSTLLSSDRHWPPPDVTPPSDNLASTPSRQLSSRRSPRPYRLPSWSTATAPQKPLA